MPQEITIKTAEMAVGRSGEQIQTNGIGSCVAIIITDKEAGVGGMAHAMLPKRRGEEDQALSPKYADEAVDLLAKEITKLGGNKIRLHAKLVGGAKMFKILSGDNHGIGWQNVEAAKEKLNELRIPLDSEDTGGTVGKIAALDTSSGLVDVSTKM